MDFQFFQDSIPFSGYITGAAGLLIASFASIISVANPLATVPVFASLTEQNTDDERTFIAKKATIFMFLILTIFLFLGTYIISFFGISLPGIRIAGGLIILRAAYAMLTPGQGNRKMSEEDKESAKSKDDISFSPLAMPLLSGPGSIAVVIGLASESVSFVELLIITVAIFISAIVTYTLLRLAPFSARYIGPAGMSAITRLMGFIVMAIAVQFILSGIAEFFMVEPVWICILMKLLTANLLAKLQTCNKIVMNIQGSNRDFALKNLMFIFLLILAACGQEKSAQNSTHSSHNSVTANEQTNVQKVASLQLNITADYVTGRFDYRVHEAFTLVAKQYADPNTYLHKQTYEAFKKMYESAKNDGVTLAIISGTRNFSDQKRIWEGKWENIDASSDLDKALQILEYSSMPATSRHHWGTDIDINNLNNSYFESGQGKKEYVWLQENANEFGFYQPYTDKGLNGRTGYNEEKWHWSYVPLASRYRAFYNQNITNADITGFKGSKLAAEIDMVGNYVNGISVKIKNYGE